MDYWRREQLGVASGIGAVVLFVIGFSLITSWPQPDATGEELREFILASRTTLLAQAFLIGVAVLAGMWFFGSMRSTLRRAEGGTGRVSTIAAAGGIGGLAFVLGGTAIGVGVANQLARTADPGVLLGFWHVSNAVFVFAAFPFVLAIGAASVVALRTGILPRWLAYGGVVPIALSAIGAVTMFYDTGTMALGGDVSFGTVMFGSLAWVLATSIVLTMRLGKTEEIAVARRRITDITIEPPPRALER